jgi:hypothetical protein
MSSQIVEEVSTKTDWSAFTILGDALPPRDPEEENEDEEDEEKDGADEPAVVREPDEESGRRVRCDR